MMITKWGYIITLFRALRPGGWFSGCLLCLVGIGGMVFSLQAEVRIKDITRVDNTRQKPLIGYGLVVGLNGSGDRASGRQGAVFTVQTISNMLAKFGIKVPRELMRTRNVAAVMVTAELPAFGRVGSKFDATAASIGDAKSLEGGMLLMTPLMDMNGKHYGMVQGPLSIGGFNIETGAGERLSKNHALVGRIPGGGQLVEAPPDNKLDIKQPLRLQLLEADFVTARRIAEAIDKKLNTPASDAEGDDGEGDEDEDEAEKYARPISAGVVEIRFPDNVETLEDAIKLIAEIGLLVVQPDIEARVVINERTGTIVAGGNVTIGEVLVSHGSLTIHTRQAPVISQPQPFSGGQTVVEKVTDTEAKEEGSGIAVLPATTTVKELSEALNQLGLKPRDMITIFQAIKRAGALRAKLIIL